MASKTTNLLRKKTGEGMALKQAEAKEHKRIRRRMKGRRKEIWRKRMRRKIIRGIMRTSSCKRRKRIRTRRRRKIIRRIIRENDDEKEEN
jgi:hypothetical protein